MLEDNVEDIKALALYFDQISIIEQRHLHIVVPINAKPVKNGKLKAEVVSTNDFTDEKFIQHLKEFKKNNVIKYQIDIDSGGQSPEKGILPVSSDMQINDLVLFHSELVGKKIKKSKLLTKKVG
jgi:hypothetical protein